MEVGEKICKLKAEDNATFNSHVKAPETKNIVCLLWIRELQCTKLSKEDLSSDTMDTLEGPKTISDLPRPGKCKQLRKHKCLFIISICS